MPEKVRIALVMNGGVSLAVWMGGVTHEIDRLRTTPADGTGPWGKILAAADRQVEVDLVAGSSAGGLNGAMLATAIARGGDLPLLLGMWRAQARLQSGKLRRRDPGDSVNSILDGQFFRDSLTTVMNGISATQPGGSDVTLLVTSSALQGSSRAVTDACGVAFRAADHRRVYRFRRRQGGRTWDATVGALAPGPVNEFEPPVDGSDPLVLAARASAGFPVAFEPLKETPALHRLNVVDSDGEPAWLMDGGVLDNAPFGPVLEELAQRPRVDAGPRWVVYVVPGMGAPPAATPASPNPEPPAWTSVLASVLSLSRESDLRSDVASVSERHREAHRTVARPDELIQMEQGLAGLPWPQAHALAAELIPVYRRTTAIETVTNVLVQQGTIQVTARPVDPQDVEAVLALNPFWIPADLETKRTMGSPAAGQWQWGVGRAGQMAAWISRAVRDLPPSPDVAEAISSIAALQEDILALEGGIGAVHAAVFAQRKPITGNLAAFNQGVIGSALLPSLTAAMDAIIQWWSTASGLTVAECRSRLLTVEVLSHALSWGQPKAPPFDLVLLSPATPEGPWLRPFETRCSLSELPHWPNPKLYGDRFMNFGAFARDSFKDWDWMWGRLDGAITLAKALLPADLPDARRVQLIDALVDEILVDCEVTREAVYERCVEVLGMRPGALIASARDSGETELNGLIDDAASMLSHNPAVESVPRVVRWVIRALLKPVAPAVKWVAGRL